MQAGAPGQLLRRLRPAEAPVTESSVCLFRLGEMCNNACPMCSNTGRAEAFFIEREELLARVGRLRDAGFRRVVLTGGEPTIHPAFWDVVAALGGHRIAWDINTHGRAFSEPSFTERACDEGLGRAIVSLHSHEVEASSVISGIKPAAHRETVEGIAALRDAAVPVIVNLVLTSLNLDHLPAFVDWIAERYPAPPALKLVFPSTTGKGGAWGPIQLRLGEVAGPVRAARARAEVHGLRLVFESVPACIHGDLGARNISRSGFGESHYLDDVTGDRLYPIEHIESALFVYGPQCAECRVIKRCSGVAEAYALRYGTEELEPARTRSAQPGARQASR